MKISNRFKGLAGGIAASTRNHLCILGVVGFAVCSAGAATYTDVLGDGQGSANLLRDISSATITNDAVNLYITLNLNPGANIATGGAFNYGIAITSGPGAGGDTSANATTHGNAYGRSISIDSSLGGMTDWIGIFGAGGAGSVGSPYTSYGYNDYAFGTPGSPGVIGGTLTNGSWTKISTVASGQPISGTPPSSISLTVPMSDFAGNLSLTPGTTFSFDVVSTGTSGNQTAYDSLVVQTVVQPGVPPGTSGSGYNGTFQYNATNLFSYTITAVPEPTTLALLGLSGVALLFKSRRRK